MKYKTGTKKLYKRRIGQPRKSQSIYDNLGHPFDIRDKEVVFVGKNEKAYSLTVGKEYKIIDAQTLKKGFCYDKALWERFKDVKNSQRRVECSQGEDHFITIINDLGHKRKYSHLMFQTIREGFIAKILKRDLT